MRRLLLVAALVALPGCLDAFRVSVPEAALQASPLDWEVTAFKQEGGNFGLRIKETRYVHVTDNDRQAPYPGVLQVFSLRGEKSTDRDALLDRAQAVVSDAVQKEGITLRAAGDAEGSRRLRSGVTTDWFQREGTIESGRGDFFDPQTRITVRILAEVGVDGRSNTGFIVVAFVKVSDLQSPILGVNPREVPDETTWFDVVADPSGNIGGASFASADRGLIYNLRTHG